MTHGRAIIVSWRTDALDDYSTAVGVQRHFYSCAERRRPAG